MVLLYATTCPKFWTQSPFSELPLTHTRKPLKLRSRVISSSSASYIAGYSSSRYATRSSRVLMRLGAFVTRSLSNRPMIRMSPPSNTGRETSQARQGQFQYPCLYICLPDLYTVTGNHGNKRISIKRCDPFFTVTVSSFSNLHGDHILSRKNDTSRIQRMRCNRCHNGHGSIWRYNRSAC